MVTGTRHNFYILLFLLVLLWFTLGTLCCCGLLNSSSTENGFFSTCGCWSFSFQIVVSCTNNVIKPEEMPSRSWLQISLANGMAGWARRLKRHGSTLFQPKTTYTTLAGPDHQRYSTDLETRLMGSDCYPRRIKWRVKPSHLNLSSFCYKMRC